MKFVYPASRRLKQSWQFDTIFRTGRRIKGKLVRLLCVSAPDGEIRCGLAVGKKLAMAHGRNRGRRILKEAVRRILPWVRPGVWIVLSLSEEGLQSKAGDIYEELSMLMKKRGMLQNDWPGPQWT